MSQVLYKSEKESLKTVFLDEDSAVRRGDAVCYERSNVDVTNAAGTTLTATSNSWGRHTYVKKPASGNLHNFAGLVAFAAGAKTGGQLIKIIEPTPFGRSVIGYTDETSVTINSTFLTVQPGSYGLGAAGLGVIIGQALQTVSAAGEIQVLLTGTNPNAKPYGSVLPTSSINVKSAAIWETCPWEAIKAGRVAGHVYHNDFLGNYTLANNQTVTRLENGISGATAATGGSVISTPLTDEPYGVVQVESTTDDEDAIICTGDGVVANYVFSSTTKLWMEARIKILNTTVTKLGIYCGFAEEALCATTALIAAAGTLADKDYVGFHKLEGDTVEMDTVWNTAAGGASPVTEGDAAVTLAADTWTNIGLYCDGTTVYFYQNGAVLSDSITIATADFPDGEEMAWYFGIMSAHGDLCSAQCDWLRIAQLR